MTIIIIIIGYFVIIIIIIIIINRIFVECWCKIENYFTRVIIKRNTFTCDFL